MALILNIDTALDLASVSLAENGIIKVERKNLQQNNHAAFLHTAIEQILHEHHCKPKDLHAIAVTIGPGSYTGLRVGLSAAKGLSFALHIPLIGITTLKAMAHAMSSAYNGYEVYFPMIDARRMEVFTALYDRSLHAIHAPTAKILTANIWEEQILQKPTVCFGNGAAKFQQINKMQHVDFYNCVDYSPSVAKLSHEDLLINNFMDVAYAEPLYTKAYNG